MRCDFSLWLEIPSDSFALMVTLTAEMPCFWYHASLHQPQFLSVALFWQGISHKCKGAPVCIMDPRPLIRFCLNRTYKSVKRRTVFFPPGWILLQQWRIPWLLIWTQVILFIRSWAIRSTLRRKYTLYIYIYYILHGDQPTLPTEV